MARTWTVTVTVGGVDVSASVTGTIQVRAEENQARTADVSLLPAAGSYDPEDWIGVAVLLDHVADPDGTPVSTRIFTGNCNWPELDDTTSVLTLHCSDLLQESFEAMDDATILSTLTGSKLSDEVFGEREDGWQRAQDALSTIRGEVHKSRTGALTLTDWAAKATADYSYTAAGILHETPRVTYAQRRELVNSISLAYQFRYDRFKLRNHDFSWSHGNFCAWLTGDFFPLPKTEMFKAAISGAGWPVHGNIGFTHLPEAGTYDCGSGPILWGGVVPDTGGLVIDLAAQEELRTGLAFSASWSARRRFVKTITEDYSITVSCAGSITLYGTAVGEDGASLLVESNAAEWTDTDDTEIPAGYTQDAIGDYVSDQMTRADSDNAVECLIQHADHRIAGSHRRNYVRWQVPCEPALDLEHTAQITAGKVTAKGKVFQVQHTLDLVAGSAITAVQIACSRGGGGTSDALDAPTPPSTAPTHQAPATSTTMDTHIGGNDLVLDWDDADYVGESYVSSNQSTISTTDPNKIYPRRVQVVSPEIEVEATESADYTDSPSYAVAVPDDTLSVSIA